MTGALLLLPRGAAQRIRSGGLWGRITCRVSDPERVGVVIALSDGRDPVVQVDFPRQHFLSSADTRPTGRWYRVPADLHGAWLQAASRTGTVVTLDAFTAAVQSGFTGETHLAVTYAPDVNGTYPGVAVPDLLAWHVSSDGARPIGLDVEPEVLGMAQLTPGWPVADLAAATAIVVGAGSIGGATALALATYGVGRILLLDPDRLSWHNLVRHVGSAHDVGKLKVTALQAQVQSQRPDTVVEAHPIDVVADAHLVRSLLCRSDVVVCAADGVAPRRVVSHLSRRANVDAILACVLEDGALGEVLRLRPWASHGCLLCHRDALTAAGAIDPEPALDARYGHGTRHRPMTAVGSDLHLVGQFAAKVAVATLLERRGSADQQLPGEHALLALRPRPGWMPPFDLSAAGETRWSGAWAPVPGCPTCEAA